MHKSLTYESDNELLTALRQGAPEAFGHLYRQYYRMVVKQVTDAGRPATEVEDLFQEVLVVLLRNIREPDFQLSAKLSTYLFAIARNLLWKKTGRPAEHSAGDTVLLRLKDDAPPVEDLAARALWEEQLGAVVGHVELLEEDCRRVLLLSFFEKRPQQEIAEAMGYSESFVKVKKHRCLEYLRKQVKANPLFKNLSRTTQ